MNELTLVLFVCFIQMNGSGCSFIMVLFQTFF